MSRSGSGRRGTWTESGGLGREDVMQNDGKPNASRRVFLVPRNGDVEAFNARCRQEAAGTFCAFVHFVEPAPVWRGETLH